MCLLSLQIVYYSLDQLNEFVTKWPRKSKSVDTWYKKCRHLKIVCNDSRLGRQVLTPVKGSVDTREQQLNSLKTDDQVSTPGKRCNVLPALTEVKQQRFDQILGVLEQGQFYPIKDVLHSKFFLRSFALNSKKMVFNGGDNVDEKLAGDAAHVGGDEAVSKKIDMKKLAQMAKGKGEPKSITSAAKGMVINAKKKGPMPPFEDKKKRPTAKALARSKVTSSWVTSKVAAPATTVLREGTSAPRG
ncbi:hypothetical protein Acr_20g0007300 [Actinidia rufa]|uniref:Uncharacterized protein n=1 Tax=Actinidia rufa TaxID=165716 RepID=A0A7J0GDV3_9ERIC|nr:hypothetical protein Acr_20g0007300 [Actinidia rufa]